jgi:hypothetical protein
MKLIMFTKKLRTMKMRAFRDVALCSLVGVDEIFRSEYCLHHESNEEISQIKNN